MIGRRRLKRAVLRAEEGDMVLVELAGVCRESRAAVCVYLHCLGFTVERTVTIHHVGPRLGNNTHAAK